MASLLEDIVFLAFFVSIYFPAILGLVWVYYTVSYILGEIFPKKAVVKVKIKEKKKPKPSGVGKNKRSAAVIANFSEEYKLPTPLFED